MTTKEEILLEIGNSEKQLWALIHSKGLLHSEVQDSYRKIRSSYESIILNNCTQSELQDFEYSLWKLHYKHIDEFRKIIKRSSGDMEIKKSGMTQTVAVQRNNDNHFKLFKLFLIEASEFYQKLIVKLGKHYGVPEKALFHKKGGSYTSVKPDLKQKCKYLCHRCLVCMGDLARYKEQCENLDIQNHNWSVAASHYLEATRIWPNSGNPQNQLAVLATYIGDEFLALYHCVRSLAVKEPFPDAWNNLILLFEKSRSSPLQYMSSELCFDFIEPSGRFGDETKEQLNDNGSNCVKFEEESNHFTDSKLWSLMVRMISFFFITSSFEEFPIALASTIGELDKILMVEDIELKTMLESYSQMDLARRGPFRGIQVVCILIFSLKNLMDKLEKNASDDKTDRHLMQLAFAAAFGVMGRFIERCLKASSLNYCPLLPSVLVFAEWCSSVVDAIEVCTTDQKSGRALSYFFDVFVKLLNQLNDNRKETKKLLDSTPLWEDFELRGFIPIACSHSPLDFCGSWEHIDNFESGTELRAARIREAATKITSRSRNLQKWIAYDKLGRFYVPMPDEGHGKNITENMESNGNSTRGEKPNQQTNKDAREHGERMTENNSSSSNTNGISLVVEEEEVILFRPLTRYNSAPSYSSISFDEQISPKHSDDQSLPSDDCLRRATSLLMAQSPAQTQTNPWEFDGSISNFRRDRSSKQQEPSTKESNPHTYSDTPISAGPPSLNAWVLDGGSLSNNSKNCTKGTLTEHRLEPIEEIASSSLAGLSVNKKENSVISSVNESSNFNAPSAAYSVPLPSAPLLPDNAAWFTDVQTSLPAPKFPESLSPISGYSDYSSTYRPPGYDPRFPVFFGGYPPPGQMTSSEWLRWYRENHKPERANNYMQPTNLDTPGLGNHENPPYHDSTHRFDHFDRWGNRLSGPGNHESFPYQDNTQRFDHFDRWGNPLSFNNQYTYIESPGPPPLQPGFIGASEHKASLFNNFQKPGSFGCGAVTELRNEPQSLLECLKEKEWRLQRDLNLRGPTFTGN